MYLNAICRRKNHVPLLEATGCNLMPTCFFFVFSKELSPFFSLKTALFLSNPSVWTGFNRSTGSTVS